MNNKRIIRMLTVLAVGLAAMVIISVLGSCSYYSEQFAFIRDEGHTVIVTHVSVLQSREASKLTTSTQTEEFIRDVNASNLREESDGKAAGNLLRRVLP